MSQEGRHDGLYWDETLPCELGEKSPLPRRVAMVRDLLDPKAEHVPYGGYYWMILRAQGSHAPGHGHGGGHHQQRGGGPERRGGPDDRYDGGGGGRGGRRRRKRGRSRDRDQRRDHHRHRDRDRGPRLPGVYNPGGD